MCARYATEDCYSGRPPYFHFQMEQKERFKQNLLAELQSKNDTEIINENCQKFKDEVISRLKIAFRALSDEEKQPYKDKQEAEKIQRIEAAIARGEMLPSEKYGKKYLQSCCSSSCGSSTQKMLAPNDAKWNCFVVFAGKEEYG